MAAQDNFEAAKLRALKRCTVELCRDMNPDAMKVELYAKKMLTSDEVERIGLPIMTTKDKNLFILQKIPSKGVRAFDYFIDALKSTSEENPSHTELMELLLRQVHTAEVSSP